MSKWSRREVDSVQCGICPPRHSVWRPPVPPFAGCLVTPLPPAGHDVGDHPAMARGGVHLAGASGVGAESAWPLAQTHLQPTQHHTSPGGSGVPAQAARETHALHGRQVVMPACWVGVAVWCGRGGGVGVAVVWC